MEYSAVVAPGEVQVVAARLDARVTASAWDLATLDEPQIGEVSAATEVAFFALKLSGKRRQARRGGHLGQLVRSFALAACVALASVAAACDKPNAGPEATQVAISQLPPDNASSATITSPPRAGPALYSDLLLLDPGTDAQPWAIALARGGDTPILIDRVGSGLDTVGDVYKVAAQPVSVGTRDGASQFLDPLQPAESTGSNNGSVSAARDQLVQRWGQDERFLAATRAISGQPIVLDAAYNAPAAVAAGGTHTYLNGVVLRVEPDAAALQMVDRNLLESGQPTRAEDVVNVAIRASERALYEPGQVVNLRDVVMDRRDTDVNGQTTTVYVANAALDGARVEPSGSVDLQALLQPRLQRVDQDLTTQSQELAAVAPAGAAAQATATPGASSPAQPVIVNNNYGNRGPSFVDDFLIFMWLSHSGFYRGPTVIINNPPSYPGRPGGDVYYSSPPTPSGSSPSTVASSQAASRSTALEAARSSVSGQSSGTGGGVAATNKSASDASAHVSAATSKSASVAGDVSSASVGKSIASAPSGSSTTASRSAGATSAGSRGTSGVSSGSSGSSSGGKGISGSSGGSSGFGGKSSSGGGGSSSS
ncbi:MAG TPA: hypothetical protein VGQ62_14685 [Chloroflexota bacterium]|nr:hypothetical protein [Chloroflexota bacterium]